MKISVFTVQKRPFKKIMPKKVCPKKYFFCMPKKVCPKRFLSSFFSPSYKIRFKHKIASKWDLKLKCALCAALCLNREVLISQERYFYHWIVRKHSLSRARSINITPKYLAVPEVHTGTVTWCVSLCSWYWLYMILTYKNCHNEERGDKKSHSSWF